MSKFTPIHEEAITYNNRNDYELDLAEAYPMCMSRSSVMTEMRVVGEHLVAEWDHITHTGKIYVLDELSNAKLGNYHRAAMHQTLAGKKNRTSGMSKALIRMSGAHKPLIKEGEDESLVKPQAVPATDGKAQELSEAQEPRRFIAWGKDISKAIAVVSRDEEAVRSYAADHFKISSFGVNVLDAALKTQMGQYGVPKKLWERGDDIVLAESKAGDIVYGAWRVGHSVQSRREKVVGKITGAARGPASGTKWVTVDDGKQTHTLPAAELTPAPGYGWPGDDGEQVMKESAADTLLTALAESKSAKSLNTSGLQAVLKDAGVPATVVDSAYAGCDADICHYFAVVESGDLFGVIGIRLMAMDGDISVLSFDTDAASVSEDKAVASEAMAAAAKKPLVESAGRADSELMGAIEGPQNTPLTEAIIPVETYPVYPSGKPPKDLDTLPLPAHDISSQVQTQTNIEPGDRVYWANVSAGKVQGTLSGTIVGQQNTNGNGWWVRVDDAHRATLSKNRNIPNATMVYLAWGPFTKIPGQGKVAPAKGMSLNHDYKKDFEELDKYIGELEFSLTKAPKLAAKLAAIYSKNKAATAKADPDDLRRIEATIARLKTVDAIRQAVEALRHDIESIHQFNASIHE